MMPWLTCIQAMSSSLKMAVTRADKQHRIMLNKIVSGFPEAERGLLRSRIVLVYLFLIVFNVAVWGLALAFSYWSPITLVVCAAAYLLGLRHAVDADHIAAVDNV